MRTHVGEALAGRRVLITGGARGIGAALAQRLHSRGARVALVGLEAELLADVALRCGNAPWHYCDVADRDQVFRAVASVAAELGGLDVLVANAGVANSLPLIGGDWRSFERTIAVNLTGTYFTLDAAGEYISHPNGYALLTSSIAAAVQLPLMGAYSASKAGVEALGNTARLELAPSGARVGVAYFGELDTDMTSRGFSSEAAKQLIGSSPFHRVTPLSVAIDGLEKAIARRSRTLIAPARFAVTVPARTAIQRLIELGLRGTRVSNALDLARREHAPLTTAQPDTLLHITDVTVPEGVEPLI